MRPDVNIKDYYLAFLTNIKNDIKTYKKEIDYHNKVKAKQEEYLISHKDIYKTKFNITFDNYNEELFKKVNSLLMNENNKVNIFYLSQIAKLKYTLDSIANYKKLINMINNRKDIKFRKFESYVNKYYNAVHKHVIQGRGYKFSNGIGIFAICRWKNNNNHKSRTLDYAATKQKKAELIAAGKKLYDKKEADWYARRNIPYDGIDYRVYIDSSHRYEIDIYRSKLFINRNHNFEHTEYINSKFRNMTYQQLANICKTDDEIANLPCDINYKFHIYLINNPSNYINYIRNYEQDPYKYGAHNRQNRQ